MNLQRNIQGLAVMLLIQIIIRCIPFANSEAIRCSFKAKSWDKYVNNPYTCVAVGLNLPTKITVDKINGNHKKGRNTSEVTALDISDQSCQQFPSGLDKFFKNLEALAIVNSRLQSITKRDLEVFPKLISVSFVNNELRTLEYLLFVNNPLLKKISIAENELMGISSDFIGSLEDLQEVDFTEAGCIDTKASTKDEVAAMKKELEEKCPPTDEMKTILDLSLKSLYCKDQLENTTTVADECTKNLKTCSNKYDKQMQKTTSLQTQLDKCSDKSDDGECKAELTKLKVQTADDKSKIKELELKLKKLKADHENLQNGQDALSKVQLKCPKDDHKSTTIECDEFIGTTCISETSSIPYDNMIIKDVKLPNGTFIDGSKITALTLSGKFVRAIPDNLGEYFTNLVSLTMKSVKIVEINEKSLIGSKKLTSLTITSTKLSNIHNDAFVDATNLMYLDLSNNQMTEVGVGISSLNKLKKLMLDKNQITTIEWKWFNRMTNIEVISVSYNPLQQVDSAFININKFKSLITVDMTRSKCINMKYPDSSVEKIKKALNDGCQFKVSLNCDYKMVGIDYVCEVNNLIIDYTNSIIDYTSGIHLSGHTTADVTAIIIKDQIIHYIPPNLISKFGTNVTKIEINNSGLLQVSHLYGLKDVKINHNNIQVIGDNSFSGSPDVETINLQWNNIEQIQPGALANNHKVQVLDFSFNNITVFSSEYIATVLLTNSTTILSNNNINSFEWSHDGPVKGEIIAENNPCLDTASGKDIEAFVRVIMDKCSKKFALECEFKYIDEDYTCVVKNLNITKPNIKISTITGDHLESSLSDDKVNKIIINKQIMHYFPANLEEIFPGLQIIEVTSSRLKKIIKLRTKFLQRIKITGNQINTIDSNPFSELLDLNAIDLSNNKITSISESIFATNTEVTEVNLNRNRLTSIKWSIFSAMPSLQSIDLSYNKLKYISWTELSTNVNSIDLTGNECINMKYSPKQKERFLEVINNECGLETTLTCKFVKKSTDYICETINLEIYDENTRITEVKGTHVFGKSAKDVTMFFSKDQNAVYYPINIRKYFTNLKVVEIRNKTCKLKVIFVGDTKIWKTRK